MSTYHGVNPLLAYSVLNVKAVVGEGPSRGLLRDCTILYSTNLHATLPGYDILPHVARSRPDLAESHTALLLSSYLQADLPTALIEVTSVDTVAVINLRKDFWVCPSQS